MMMAPNMIGAADRVIDRLCYYAYLAVPLRWNLCPWAVALLPRAYAYAYRDNDKRNKEVGR